MGARTPLRAPTRRGTFVAACTAVLAFAFATTASAAELGIDMQVQQQDEWCWAASGDTIATFLGHGTDQNSFCDLAIGQDTSQQCPNQPGQLAWDQNAFQSLGISPGVESGAVGFDQIVSDIDAGHPLETGISWTAGGGHAEVIYGYDSASQTISFGDPWPDDQRMNQMDYNSYVSNDQFTWDDTLSQIGA
ncbi:hypothetical protein ABH920_003613 [Catenulispora sp. EB89]|uniref:papain-like cysteine protease family protein n=1 Tax=Catenulispora sp. EB89 TaxID=3156257 RepID=UPI003516539D